MKKTNVNKLGLVLLALILTNTAFTQANSKQEDKSSEKKPNRVLVKLGTNHLQPDFFDLNTGISLSGSYMLGVGSNAYLQGNASFGINANKDGGISTGIFNAGYRHLFNNFSIHGNVGYMDASIIAQSTFTTTTIDLPRSFGLSFGTAYDFPLKYNRALSLFVDYHLYGKKLNFKTLQIGLGYSFIK